MRTSEARLGQTEHGSYVLTILSPVSPQLNAYSDTELFPEDPFQRQVIRTLAQSVDLTVQAAEQSVSSSNFEPFQSAVTKGVSANLCEAISRLFKVGNTMTVSFSVSWAQNRPEPVGYPTRIRINREVVPVIEEAARIFRAHDSLDGYLVQGSVIKLERAANEGEGRVTVMAKVEDNWRKVVITLPPAEYERALKAHQGFRPVKVTGNIIKEGRTYRLNQPSGFDFAPEDDDE